MYIRAFPKQQFDPPLRTLWNIFFAENKKILKTVILTLGTNVLTVTVLKNYSIGEI